MSHESESTVTLFVSKSRRYSNLKIFHGQDGLDLFI